MGGGGEWKSGGIFGGGVGTGCEGGRIFGSGDAFPAGYGDLEMEMEAQLEVEADMEVKVGVEAKVEMEVKTVNEKKSAFIVEPSN